MGRAAGTCGRFNQSSLKRWRLSKDLQKVSGKPCCCLQKDVLAETAASAKALRQENENTGPVSHSQ